MKKRRFAIIVLSLLLICSMLSACDTSEYQAQSDVADEDSLEYQPQTDSTEESLDIYDLCIPASEALNYVGEEVMIVGYVVSWASPDISGHPLFINLDADYPDENRCQIVLWDGIRQEYVDDLGERLLDKTVVVNGVVENYEGVAQITMDEDGFIMEKDEFLMGQ